MQSTSLKSLRARKESIFEDQIVHAKDEGTMYEQKFRRNAKNKKLTSKAYLYDSESSASD